MTATAQKLLLGGRFLFDPSDNTLIDKWEADEITRLGTNESRALLLLSEEPNDVITRQQLHNYVWRQQGFEVDDSSITQAISTLRKALKDSTKSPLFIKTVPKRGYQVIASVEPYIEEITTKSAEFTEIDTAEELPVEPANDSATEIATPRWRVHWLKGLAVLVTIAAPCLAYYLPPPPSQFESVLEVDGVPVVRPDNQPAVAAWSDLINQCVLSYIAHNADIGKPDLVIATDGQQNQVYLNYVHAAERSHHSTTIRLLPNRKDNTLLCR
uniref:winged helix-turn-helix domain-containing protein n=1 Tax=Thaumasiovibrio occultus TaxID=1891184 RepID=UPI000B36320A|nr:transcriptional regulator [Thaumasiovibrio occultus]